MTKQLKQPPPTATGFSLGDIYHLLFRHKWKILAIWAIGLAAAAAMKFTTPISYSSKAKLYVRYVLDKKSVMPLMENKVDITSPDPSGAGIMPSQMEILRSYDLALQVADSFGPSNILASTGGGNDRYRAASAINRGMKVATPVGTAVILVTFEHPDRNIVQPVLRQIVTSYLKTQAEIHRAAGTQDDALNSQADVLKAELQQIDTQIWDTKKQLGILSLNDSKKGYTDRLAKLQDDLDNAEAELAVRKSALEQMTNMLAANSPTETAAQPLLPPEIVREYRNITVDISSLEKRGQELRMIFQGTMVNENEDKIKAKLAAKEKLEAQYPALLSLGITGAGTGDVPLFSRAQMVEQAMMVVQAQVRIDALKRQLAALREKIEEFGRVEGELVDLERRKALHESYLQSFSASLFASRINNSVSAGEFSNISVIEFPTPPIQIVTSTGKLLAMVLFGALAGGLALAFVVENYLDRSFKRPIEVENYLRSSVLLSIPRAKIKKKHRIGKGGVKLLLENAAAEENAGGSNGSNGGGRGTEVKPWQNDHSLGTYFETLRDRIILYFDAQELTHKPKLVAVTSCAENTGVSTIASGLAASLSKTGDGNVLLVDMNEVNGSAAAFFHKGELQFGLDDALENEKRGTAQVQEKLYVVSEKPTNGNVQRVLHKRFSSLMPKLRASDYDYIIFDMPPVSQLSPTPRLARFMDIMIMAVEAERTDRDVVKRATDLLREAGGNVAMVLNKTRSYVPKALQQDL